MDHGKLLHRAHLDRRYSKILHHGSTYGVETPSPKGMTPGDVGKMHGIEYLAARVEEGSEMHGIAVFCPGIFCGYHVTHDVYGLAHFLHEVACHGITAKRCVKQFEGITQWK